ncbi:MAG: Xaa-Pro peptidase family protein [Catonella sp.]|nr:Xaa-Pro peptidase family protein [Catonella sp.]MDY6356341.1 Xaa-Pro peptidase family protein [Catonella sp.]
MNEKRINRAIENLKKLDLTQMLVTDPMSIYYFTGVYVQPYERFFAFYINAEGENVLFLNKLFVVPEVPIRTVVLTDTDNVISAIEGEIDKDRILGVDKNIEARFLLPLIDDKAAAGFKNGSLAIDLTRGVKDEDEIKLMRKASEINDAAMAQFKGLIHDGVTELEVADKMLGIYKSLGAEGYSFEPIVSFGANAADPHHEPDNTVIKEGDCVLFDVGCKYKGYCSDMTRTFYYKTVSDHARQIYELTLKANLAAEALISPKARLCELDKAARDLITEGGYGEEFNHRLGHFIGLKEHEYGDVSSAYDWQLLPGMIFSIEPGIYLSGDTGVRIEDLNLVTPDGVETLNHYPKELQLIY